MLDLIPKWDVKSGHQKAFWGTMKKCNVKKTKNQCKKTCKVCGNSKFFLREYAATNLIQESHLQFLQAY